MNPRPGAHAAASSIAGQDGLFPIRRADGEIVDWSRQSPTEAAIAVRQMERSMGFQRIAEHEAERAA